MKFNTSMENFNKNKAWNIPIYLISNLVVKYVTKEKKSSLNGNNLPYFFIDGLQCLIGRALMQLIRFILHTSGLCFLNVNTNMIRYQFFFTRVLFLLLCKVGPHCTFHIDICI